VYTVRFHDAIYVLHAFQKKSTSGIATSRQDIDLIRPRRPPLNVITEKGRPHDDQEDEPHSGEGQDVHITVRSTRKSHGALSVTVR
jgi:hypothetical protein